ncbi:MAG: hypothetical protein SGI71_05025 [Verrucomicrobiota bacterium]|nr:hypothetical protein [Verrucomicrobiota bacterium]
MKKFIPLLFVISVAVAQTPPQVESVDQQRRRSDVQKPFTSVADTDVAPELYPGESSDVGPQYIVKRKPVRKWFEVTGDSQYYYTSNMFLAEESVATPLQDTMMWVNTLQFAVAPRPGWEFQDGVLYPRIGYRHQWYVYGLGDKLETTLNNFDFEVDTAFGDVTYEFLETWQASLGVDFTRLYTDEADANEFYEEAVPRWGVSKFFQVDELSGVSLAYDGNYHVTRVDPLPREDVNDRMDHTFTLSYTRELIPSLYARPYYRFQVTEYTEAVTSRTDLLNTLGVMFAYNINEWSNVRTFFNYDMRDSDNPIVADYDKFDGGLGVTLNFKF